MTGVPTGTPEVTVTEAFVQCEMDPDEIEFLGMWCALVLLANFPSVTVKHFTIKNMREIQNVSEIDKNETMNLN